MKVNKWEESNPAIFWGRDFEFQFMSDAWNKRATADGKCK